MTVRLELKIDYDSEEAATAVLRSLEPDNAGFVGSERVGNVLMFTIEGVNAGVVRNAADDLLACVKIAEEASGLSDAVADLDGDALPE